jgi:hypothetical protein
MPNFPLPRASVFAAVCALGLASPVTAGPALLEDDAVRLRTQGPTALTSLLARWDHLAAGPDRDALALTIDAVAGQRYATTSRLFWYTDLATAEAAAHTQHRPILALRMLGRLDEDLSCANSRFFRTTLYANTHVSSFLREHFILYWSSVRPVPHVTIDFGDGRKLERTTTGNSAHYVLDETGAVLDVLPGLYAPGAFERELHASLALATAVRGQGVDARARLVAGYHTKRVAETRAAWDALGEVPYIRGKHRLLAPDDVKSALATAQRATMSKAFVEVPDLQAVAAGADPGTLPEDADLWASVGQRLYSPGTQVLDQRSRALIEALHDAVPTSLVASREAMDAVIARLEQHIVADTALNQLKLRPQISKYLAAGHTDFADVDTWIYDNVFGTPSSDAWLGLLPRTEFTGLPGDGVVLPPDVTTPQR